MANETTARQSRLRIKPDVYSKLETLALACKRRPTDHAEFLIEQAFERTARKSNSPAVQPQPEAA